MKKLALLLIFLWQVCFCDKSPHIRQALEIYLNEIQEEELKINQKIPIYEDFITKEKELELRRYLLNSHLKQAQGKKPIASEKELNHLVSLQSEENLWYFYNVPANLRFGEKEVKEILEKLSFALQKKLSDLGLKGKLKFAVSSAVRPIDYQKNLRKVNENAALVSSHSYGLSVDIFYDEFYYNINPPKIFFEIKELEKWYRQTGFFMGRSLRRQFHTLLTETLLDLQKQNKILVILEKNQRSYHITPRLYPESS